MPKLKTKRAAAKRFRKTANGFKRGQSHRRHILTKKPSKRKRQLRREMHVDETDVNRDQADASVRLDQGDNNMARVKRGVVAGRRHKKILKKAKGYLQCPAQGIPHGQAGRHQGRPVCLSRPAREEARVPRAVDHAHQRRRAAVRADLQHDDRRTEQGGSGHRPQGACRPGGA